MRGERSHAGSSTRNATCQHQHENGNANLKQLKKALSKHSPAAPFARLFDSKCRESKSDFDLSNRLLSPPPPQNNKHLEKSNFCQRLRSLARRLGGGGWLPSFSS